MPCRRPVILMYPGAQINTALQRIANDIINIELESATGTGIRKIRKSTLKCNCKLRLKKLLSHGNCSDIDPKQETDIQNIPDQTALISYQRNNSEEAPENLVMKIENLENNLENFVPEFETPGNNLNYFEEEIESPENKSEIDEETEHELQGNDGLGAVNEKIIERAQMLQANKEAAVSKPNDKLKIEILENIVIKHAIKKSDKILKRISDRIVLKEGNCSSKVDKIENVIAQKSNVNEQINDGKDKLLKASNEIVLIQTNSNAKVEDIHNIESKNNEPTTENTSIKTRKTETIDLNKPKNESTEKAAQFDNFKVPKKVTRSKKKIVKKRQPRFVLTHVVGGYIIQESNFAFPIREPQRQKNKPKTSITKETTQTEIKEEKVIQEESGSVEPVPTKGKEKYSVLLKENGTEDPAPPEVKEEKVVRGESGTVEPVPIEVKEEKKEYAKEDVINGEFNPFARLQQSTVKSWTVEDLSNHLLKFNWEETASLLQDNEIDGASLFLVTKTQLMIIGVNEEHADAISEFVQIGSSKGN